MRSFPEPPPADAETFQGLRFERIDSGRRPCVKAWKPKGTKPYAHYSFGLALDRERWIEEQKERHTAWQTDKRERREKGKAEALAMCAQMEPGAVLSYSWGYDQTQVEFFQVIERRGLTVTLREIAPRPVEGSDGFMCDSCLPCPGRFVGDPFRKRINSHGVSMDHGTASPVDTDRKHHRSWYA